MDLSTLNENVKNGYYEDQYSFEKDLNKIWENSLRYNIKVIFSLQINRTPKFTT